MKIQKKTQKSSESEPVFLQKVFLKFQDEFQDEFEDTLQETSAET